MHVWIAPPGWRPPDVAARFPKAAYDPSRGFSRYDPPRNLALSAYASVQFLALLAANSHFLSLLAKQGNGWNAVYFAFLLASLFCLGGVLESRREFLLLEAVRMAGVAIAALGGGVWFGGVRNQSVIASIAIFAMASLAGLWVATRKAATATPEPATLLSR